jgi:hypothetical protein
VIGSVVIISGLAIADDAAVCVVVTGTGIIFDLIAIE